MKIENYEGTADTFIFPNNPRVFDDDSNTNNQTTPFPFTDFSYMITGGSFDAKSIILDGQFNEADSTNKRDDFNTLASHVKEAKLKKLYFASDRFYICLGRGIKQTNSGDRIPFIDYVARFTTPISILFSDTQKSASYNGTTWTNGTATNAGETRTYIEQIDVTLDTTESAGQTIIINDNSDNGITVTLDAYSASDVLTIYMIKLVSIGSNIDATEFFYAELNGTQQATSQDSTKNSPYLRLEAGEQIDNFTFGGTASYSDITLKWRDSYLG